MDAIEAVKNYYGKVLKKSQDMRSGLCNSNEPPPPHLRKLIRNIAGEICEKFYGCGCPLPPALAGCSMLDLGCGAGRDVYLASQLVGPQGFVTGVDMTQEQLDVAQRHLDEQMRKFGYDQPNVRFLNGYIEDLRSIGLENDSFDVVISDNTINLSPAKPKVFREIFRVLKPGGELYFCDVFASRRVPPELSEDPMLVGECLAGAMYFEDCRRMLREAGCPDVRVVSIRRIPIDNREILARCGDIEFHAMTLRAFKLASLEDGAEDYGQVAYYLGNLADAPRVFTLDLGHSFIPACPMRVCGNTAAMLTGTRLASHFHVIGDRAFHFGPFTPLTPMRPPLGAAMANVGRKEPSQMMATTPMPTMMNESARGEKTQQSPSGMMGGMMPGMGMMMGGMMSPAMAGNMIMQCCNMMQNACQELVNCCRGMMNTPMANRANETINSCNQMINCCNETMQCCRSMMVDQAAMGHNAQQMMTCCMDMMAACNMLMASCRNLVMQGQVMPMMMMGMGQQHQPMGMQCMQACMHCMNCCMQMMGACNMMMQACRSMMMNPGMMHGGMQGSMGPGMMGGMMSGMMPGMMGGMGSMMNPMMMGMNPMMAGMGEGSGYSFSI